MNLRRKIAASLVGLAAAGGLAIGAAGTANAAYVGNFSTYSSCTSYASSHYPAGSWECRAYWYDSTTGYIYRLWVR